MIDFTKVLFAASDSIQLHMYCSVFISRLEMIEDEKVVGLAAKLIVARKTTPRYRQHNCEINSEYFSSTINCLDISKWYIKV